VTVLVTLRSLGSLWVDQCGGENGNIAGVADCDATLSQREHQQLGVNSYSIDLECDHAYGRFQIALVVLCIRFSLRSGAFSLKTSLATNQLASTSPTHLLI